MCQFKNQSLSYFSIKVISSRYTYWLKHLFLVAHINDVMGFPDSAMVKKLPANAGGSRDAGLIPELRRSPGVGNGNILQYSCLENSMDRGTWWATFHRVAKNQTQLSTHTQITEYNGTSYNVWCDLHFIEWKTEVWGKLSPKPHSWKVEGLIYFTYFSILNVLGSHSMQDLSSLTRDQTWIPCT